MSVMLDIAKSGSEAVRQLRLQKFKSGNPFMINSRELPTNQFYLEFPEGKIVLAKLTRGSLDFTVIRTLRIEEQAQLRIKFNIPV